MLTVNFPFLFFPTTIAFLDDDKEYLNALHNIFKTQFSTQTFSSVKNFCDYVDEEDLLFEKLLSVVIHDDIAHSKSDLTYSFFRDHPEKTNLLSVLIIDYDMPYMNGIDVCKKYQDKTFKKILLTGQANEDDAIRAFNEGLIDGYINKGDVDLSEKLLSLIKETQNKFFSDVSKYFYSDFSSEESEIFKMDSVKSAIQEFVYHNHITEYYYIKLANSFVLRDEKQNLWKLVFLTPYLVNGFTEIIREVNGPKELVDKIYEYEEFPMFPNIDGFYEERFEEGWEEFLCKVQPLKTSKGQVYICSNKN